MSRSACPQSPGARRQEILNRSVLSAYRCAGGRMEPVIDLAIECLDLAIEGTSLSPGAAIWQDVLAQAMTGELVAAMNYTSLAEICDDPEEAADRQGRRPQLPGQRGPEALWRFPPRRWKRSPGPPAPCAPCREPRDLQVRTARSTSASGQPLALCDDFSARINSAVVVRLNRKKASRSC
jgi:hypothetical protein